MKDREQEENKFRDGVIALQKKIDLIEEESNSKIAALKESFASEESKRQGEHETAILNLKNENETLLQKTHDEYQRKLRALHQEHEELMEQIEEVGFWIKCENVYSRNSAQPTSQGTEKNVSVVARGI